MTHNNYNFRNKNNSNPPRHCAVGTKPRINGCSTSSNPDLLSDSPGCHQKYDSTDVSITLKMKKWVKLKLKLCRHSSWNRSTLTTTPFWCGPKESTHLQTVPERSHPPICAGNTKKMLILTFDMSLRYLGAGNHPSNIYIYIIYKYVSQGVPAMLRGYHGPSNPSINCRQRHRQDKQLVWDPTACAWPPWWHSLGWSQHTFRIAFHMPWNI